MVIRSTALVAFLMLSGAAGCQDRDTTVNSTATDNTAPIEEQAPPEADLIPIGDATSLQETETASPVQETSRAKPRAAAKPQRLASAPSLPIVMMWQVQQSGPRGDFEELRSLGVNTVQASRLATWPAAEVQEYLDGAEKTGLKVIVYLGIFREGEAADCHYRDEALQFVEKYKPHPAIYAWHSVDEPAEHKVTRACQRTLYKAIKKVDPYRPIMVSSNNNSESRFENYFDEDAFDIYETHKYVNPRPAIAQERLLKLFVANRKRDYPVIITLRAYNAPHKQLRQSMTGGSLKEQYDYFITEPKITRNVAFYGWKLSPSIGIKDDPALRAEFVELMRSKVKAPR